MELGNKYDALVEGEDGQSIVDHYASIIELKKSEAKINLLISLEETQEEEKEELRAMKENIEVALKEELGTLRDKEKAANAYPLSTELLAAHDVGKLAKYFHLADRKWRNSVVQEVDVEEQTANIKRYGTN